MARILATLEAPPAPRPWRWLGSVYEAALVAHRRRHRLVVLAGHAWPEERHNAVRNRLAKGEA